ncbi:MAG TPA: hypothetical protein VIU61_02245 [Kofleriaceae bacterium]
MKRAICIAILTLLANDAAAGDTCDGDDTVSIVGEVIEALFASGSGSSSEETRSGPAEAACEHDVHGYSECKEFGAWSTRKAAVNVELGTAVRTFASPLGERHGTIMHEQESFSYRVAGSERPDTAVVGRLRATVGWRHGLYAGVESEVGALTKNNAAAEMTSEGMLGTPDIRQTSAITYGGLAVAGIGKRLGPVEVGAESAAGFRALAYHYSSAYLACETSTSITAVMPVLEARARGSVWVTPFVSVGATYGKSLVDVGSVGGLYMQWSTRAFGGR